MNYDPISHLGRVHRTVSLMFIFSGKNQNVFRFSGTIHAFLGRKTSYRYRDDAGIA